MKLMTRCLIITNIIIVAMMIDAVNVAALGWGYTKTMDNTPPDVGKYAEMLEGRQAYYIDDTDEKVIYLTFDNGYELGFTEPILDVLKEENVPATFFVNGHYVTDQPELIKRMVEDGHIIGNHAYNHYDFSTLSKESIEKELKSLEKAVANVSTQKTTPYMRPPSGTFNQNTIDWIDELGYVQFFWSLTFKDWEKDKNRGWKYAYDQIMKQVHPGAIIFLHSVTKDNADAMDKVIKQLKMDGYQFKSLDDFMLKKQLPEGLDDLMF